MYGNKALPERLDIKGPKGQTIPDAKINLEYYVTKSEFQHMLYDEKLKYSEIIKRIGYPYDSSNFSRMVRKLNWKTGLGKVDRYTVNERFFDTWSRESAWVTGWLVTDGHINERSVDLTLQKQDKDVIDKVKSLLEFSGKKYERSHTETIRIYNRTLVDSLYKAGIPKENKTFDCKMPYIPEKYMWDFIRGAFEGDGSIGRYKSGLAVNICGASKEFMLSINKFLNEHGVETRVTYKRGNFYTVHASGMGSALRWLYFMYANTDDSIRMNRKFNKYIDFVKTFYDVDRKVVGAVELVELARQTIPECADEIGEAKRQVI